MIINNYISPIIIFSHAITVYSEYFFLCMHKHSLQCFPNEILTLGYMFLERHDKRNLFSQSIVNRLLTMPRGYCVEKHWLTRIRNFWISFAKNNVNIKNRWLRLFFVMWTLLYLFRKQRRTVCLNYMNLHKCSVITYQCN